MSQTSTGVLLTLWVLGIVAMIGLPPVPASNLAWDGFNGLGFAASLTIVGCCWLAPSRHAGYSFLGLRAHAGLSLLVLVAVTVHAVGLLLTNEVAIEYLKWRAPAYMHAGNAAFVLLLLVALSSIKRIRRVLHSNFDGFRRVHRILSALLVGLAGWHVIGSGFLSASGHGVTTAWTEYWNPPDAAYWRGWGLALLLLVTNWLWWQQPHRSRPTLAPDSVSIWPALGSQLLLTVLTAGAYLVLLQWGTTGSEVGNAPE